MYRSVLFNFSVILYVLKHNKRICSKCSTNFKLKQTMKTPPLNFSAKIGINKRHFRSPQYDLSSKYKKRITFIHN